MESNSRVQHSPELFIPLGLLSFTVLTGVYRYFFVLRVRSYYRPLLSDITAMASGLGQATIALVYIVAFTYVASLAVICLRVLIERIWSGTLLVMYNVTSLVAVAASLLMMHIEVYKGGHWSWANYGFWWLLLTSDSFIGWFRLEGIPTEGSSPNSKKYDLALVSTFLFRYVLLWIIALLSVVHYRKDSKVDGADALRALDPETTEAITDVSSLSQPSIKSSLYGTFTKAFISPEKNGKSLNADYPTTGSSSGAEIKEDLKKGQEEQGHSFKDLWTKMKRLFPFMYPKGNIWLQFLIILTGFFLLLGRVVNLLVPIQTKRVVSRLYTDDPFGAWDIVLYVAIRFIQNLITGLRGWAWIPVQQYSHSTLTIWLLEHVHNLSLQFHLNRKTGELLRIMDRGTTAVMSLLGTVLFRLFPAVADALIAVVYFCVAWNWRYSVIVFTTIVTYVVVTVVVTEWRTKYRRDMVACDNEVRAITVDSLLNYETIKYDAAEEFETERYREAIREFVIADYRSQFSNHLLTLLQAFVITMGTLAGCLLCAYEISIGKSEPANFVAYTVYLNQLYPPMNRFGQNYGALQQKVIDMEKMLKLLEQDQTVKDVPGAERLEVQKGEIVFQNVGFHYDSRQQGLQNINFTVPKGGTVALVGSTGSGKSTILRLLFRFYDVTSGRILIDGQDISQKTQTSLREQIGVVPQDVVLLNDTIYNNIRHGRPSATEEQVKMAAKAAQIHDKIMTLPDQYDTKVGERALKLSGGEKQRVAIARTILKNPPIVLLDEATSALDPVTESQIQAELARMTENRTTLVVTHRLSTIVNADLILCIEDGIIVEQGTHSELIGRGLANGGKGVYYEMWRQQSTEEQTDGSTLDGTLSDDSETKKKRKGKKRKEHHSLQQPDDHAVAMTLGHPVASTSTTTAAQESTNPAGSTRVVVESPTMRAMDNEGKGGSGS